MKKKHAYAILDFDEKSDELTLFDPSRKVEIKDSKVNSSVDCLPTTKEIKEGLAQGENDGIFPLSIEIFDSLFHWVCYEK